MMAGKKRQSDSLELKWMDRALDLAELGRYTVSPNPMVGAVLVRGDRLIGEASCQIDTVDARHICRLTPKTAMAGGVGEEAIRTRFLDLVTDENLREKIA